MCSPFTASNSRLGHACPMPWVHETHVLLCFKWHHLMIQLKKLVDFQTSWTQTSLNMASGLCFYGPEKEQMELCGKFSGRPIFL